MRFTALALAWLPLVQDRVVLTDGKAIEGRVIYVDEEQVLLRQGGKDRHFERQDVAELDWTRERLGVLLRRERALPDDSVAANSDLARFAHANGLRGEARALWWRVLLLDPEHAGAHEALGHSERRGRWSFEHDRRTHDLESFRAAIRDWSHAFELETTHFSIKTNLPLAEAVELPLTLERFYLELYTHFGADFELYECTAPMQVSVHADAVSFPDSLAGGRAYFSELSNTLFIDASGGLSLYELLHEATHQILHTACELETRRSSSLPPWLDEGFADYVASSATYPPEPLAIDPGRPNPIYFRMHADSDDPLSLARVLGLQIPDFASHTRWREMYAQSYTLVHWCLHADGGAHRAAFFEYVLETFAGRASPTRFKQVLDLPRDFEAIWQAYAIEQAG